MTGYDLKDIGFRKFPWRKPLVSAMETDGFLHDNQWFPLRQLMYSFMATIGTRQGEQCIPPERTTVSAVATVSGTVVLDSKNRAFTAF